MKKENYISDTLDSFAKQVQFAKGFKLNPLENNVQYKKIKDSGLSIDYRAEESLFGGIDFDATKLRSRTYSINNGNEVAGIMTLLIGSYNYISKIRYFEKNEKGIFVKDIQSILKSTSPDYLIIPAWTNVKSKYKGSFAISGFNFFKRSMEFLMDESPNNTWLELVAQGEIPCSMKDKIEKILENNLGKLIPKKELPFKLDMIGKNINGSNSVIKVAKLIGLERIKNVGAPYSLGPVFAKKVK